MKITNNLELPVPLYRAVSYQRPRVSGRISVTELITPPQIRALSFKHWDDMEEDASTRIWAALGTLMHTLLEKHGQNIEGHLTEHFMEVEIDGYTVSGVADLLDTHTQKLTDYKFVSVWSTIEGVKREWIEQANLYSALFRRKGQEVKTANIVAIFRDWSKNKASQDTTYPQTQVQIYDLDMWPSEQAERFLLERLALHRTAEGGTYPECSSEERWEKPEKWALHKAGQKRAVKLFDTKSELDAYVIAFGLDKGHYSERRPGVSTRCESYCSVAPYCRQYLKIRNETK